MRMWLAVVATGGSPVVLAERDSRAGRPYERKGAPLRVPLADSGNDLRRSGDPAGGILLADADGTTNVFRVVLVAPETEGVGLEKVEEEPGEAFFVHEGEQRLALDRVEAGDAK